MAAFDLALRAWPDIMSGAGWVVRVAGWFTAGMWGTVTTRWLWVHFGRRGADLPGLVWGGVAMIVVQMLVLVIKNKRMSLQ